MSLQTNTVDAKAVGLDKLGDADSACSLGTTILEVVVVVVELGGRVCSQNHAESNGDECLADDTVEDTVTVSSVLIES